MSWQWSFANRWSWFRWGWRWALRRHSRCRDQVVANSVPDTQPNGDWYRMTSPIHTMRKFHYT
jgi:hypothetical protein